MSPQLSSGSLYLSSSFSAGKICLKPLSPDLYGLHNAYCTCLFECALLGYMFWKKEKKDKKFIFMSLTLALTSAQVHWSIVFPKCWDKLYKTEEVLWLGLCPWEGQKINNRSALHFPIVDFSTCFLSGPDLLGRKWCHQLNNVWEY